jgi:hypothetical protein
MRNVDRASRPEAAKNKCRLPKPEEAADRRTLFYMTCYLIDFENVHEDGFAGIGKLAQDDVVYCFFTRNAPKISLSVLAESKGIQFRFIEASAGKQSLDLALGSYLGYLIAQEDKDTRFVIISNDTGYLKIADFWNRRFGANTVRECPSMEAFLEPPASPQPIVQPAQKKPAERQRKGRQMVRKPTAKPVAAAPQPAKEQLSVPTAPAPVPAPVPQPVRPAEPAEPKPAQEAQQKETAPREEPDPAAMEYIQAQIAKYAGEKNIRQLVYRAIVRKYGQKQGTKLYNGIKKTITVQRSEPAKEPQE